MSKETQSEEKLKEALATELQKLKDVKGPLMTALQKVQEIYGYLPQEALNTTAEFFNVPLAEIYGIATFYSQFNLKPKGKCKIGVCMGTACYVKGSGDILERFKVLTGLNPGETSETLQYSLEATRCIGCCGLAPVFTVNEDVYGNIKADGVADILKKYDE